MNLTQEPTYDIDLFPPTQSNLQRSQLEIADNEIRQAQEILNNIMRLRDSIQPNIAQLSESEFGTITCDICAESVNAVLYEKFCCSLHKYCKKCILSVLHQNLNNFRIAKCPDPECLVELNQHSPFYSKMSEYHRTKLMKIRRNRQVLKNPKVKLCRKVDCDGTLNLDKHQCSLCKEKHCAKCLEVTHEGKCDKYIKGGLKRKYKFKRCPNCRMMIQRSQGCNHMSCVCGCQFCYQCGDLFFSSHSCKQNSAKSYFDQLRQNIANESHDINKFINCLRIMQLLEPDISRSIFYRYVYFFILFTVFYPLVIAVILSIAVLVLGLYLAVCGLIVNLYFMLLALMEIINLQLPPSTYLFSKGVPLWLIRILMVPLFPVNLIFCVKQTSGKVFFDEEIIQKLKGALLPVLFFLLLPCLLIENQVEDELE